MCRTAGRSNVGCSRIATVPTTTRYWESSGLRNPRPYFSTSDFSTLKSVRHRMQQHVDAEGVAVGRELQEELRILAFTFPRVGNVGVVGRHHHDPPVRVADDAQVHRAALLAAFRGLAPAAPSPELDVGDLRH